MQNLRLVIVEIHELFVSFQTTHTTQTQTQTQTQTNKQTNKQTVFKLQMNVDSTLFEVFNIKFTNE
jgi:hypothetical protein